MNTLSIGTQVRRVTSVADYANGRTGEIVEIDETAGRYRVRWTKEQSGRDINEGRGLRTWCKYDGVEAVL